MNFHLYNYLNYRNKQFAVVENPGFWNWTFTLKDENDNVLAQIDRDWRGVGFEVRFIYQICIFITTVTAVACFAILISKEYLDAWKICSIACQSFKNWCLLGSFVFVYLCILHYVFILLSGICFFNRNLGICWRTVSTFLKLVLCSRLSYIKRLETQAIVYSNMVIIMRTYVVVWKEILRFWVGFGGLGDEVGLIQDIFVSSTEVITHLLNDSTRRNLLVHFRIISGDLSPTFNIFTRIKYFYLTN